MINNRCRSPGGSSGAGLGAAAKAVSGASAPKLEVEAQAMPAERGWAEQGQSMLVYKHNHRKKWKFVSFYF